MTERTYSSRLGTDLRYPGSHETRPVLVVRTDNTTDVTLEGVRSRPVPTSTFYVVFGVFVGRYSKGGLCRLVLSIYSSKTHTVRNDSDGVCAQGSESRLYQK